jgi:peptide/nickel transport system permease protein
MVRLPRALRGVPLIPIGILVIIVLCGVLAPWITPHDPKAGNLSTSLIPPFWEKDGSWTYILGTDQQGRDILSRLIAGARVSLLIGVTAVGISGAVGLTFALLGGYYGGVVDAILGRVVDAMLSLPFLTIAIVLATVVKPGVQTVILILGFTGWSGYARVLRSEVLRIKEQDFIALARVGGCSTPRILLRYVAPGLLNTFIVLATLQLGTTILAASTLSFLGIGVQPPNAAWGLMLADGRQYVTYAWWLAVFPGVAIMLTVLSVNTIGDWLRVRFDPKMRQL